MWERTLQDLVRGLRANKNNESRFIAGAIDEIRREVRSDDMELKAAAVVKLTYLEMLGYNMGWASFHVVEVMSSPKFHLKSMGYLAATQSFEQDTDVLMLTTNLLKKDMSSADAKNVAVSLNGLSHIVTPDLGRDLSRDLITLLTHSRPAIRKRAILALYRVCLKYPEALEFGMDRLKERLEDPDGGVVCAVVNVLCELAKQDPKAYLSFAPPLFQILTTSNNNWMLIKIIKLFGLLTPLEPRLIKKLQPPITDLISTTPAISLLYECVHTCIIGGMLTGSSGFSLAKTCVTKLASFLSDRDQNLKYIALLALTKIVPTHPHLVADYEAQILESINDSDLSIRMRALDLLSAMVNEHNLQSIVQQLLSLLVDPGSSSNQPSATGSLEAATRSATEPLSLPAVTSPAYRETLARRILSICSADLYAYVTDFQWYISVLVDVAYVARAPVGLIIRDHLVDVVARVRQVRTYAVQVSMRILEDDTFLQDGEESTDEEDTHCREILWAAAWICGEHGAEYAETQKVLSRLLSEDIANLPSDIVSVYIQSAGKIFGSWAAGLADNWDADNLPELKSKVELMIEGLRRFAGHTSFEVQERAAELLQLFKFIQADLTSYQPRSSELENGFASESTSAFDPIGTEEPAYPKSLFLLHPLFSTYDLNPVAPEAQASVFVPEGLNLDAWIVPEAMSLEPEVNKEAKKKKKGRKGKGKDKEGGDGDGCLKTKKGRKKKTGDVPELTQEEIAEAEALATAKARRMEELRDDPYYIMDNRPKTSNHGKHDSLDIESIPVVRLVDLPPPSSVSVPAPTPLLSTPSLFRPIPSPQRQVSFTVDRGGEMPPGSLKHPSPLGSKAASISSTPLRSGSPAIAPSSPFQPYEVSDDVPKPGTPQPIKVERKKKKKKTKAEAT